MAQLTQARTPRSVSEPNEPESAAFAAGGRGVHP